MTDTKHYVILGGGLAGSFMAARLCHAGQRVTLIDDRAPNSASRVAAGLFNVITGRFGAKSWLADDLLAEIKAFFSLPAFQELEKYLHYTPIYRPFRTVEAYNKWTGRSSEPGFAHLVDFQESPILPHQLINPNGGIMIKSCGWVDTAGLIQGMQQVMEMSLHLRRLTGHLSYSSIDLEAKTIQLREEKLPFDHLICCEGYQLQRNPWFSQTQVIPNKGEILYLEIPDLDIPFALSKKIYLVPAGENHWVCGATYVNSFAHPDPTAEGRAEIEQHLQRAIRVPYKVLDHWAGIRPTTPNRRPIVGTHPEIDYLHVLGGFGTKGMLLAPMTSRWLLQLLLEGEHNVPAEASVQRFWK